MAVHVGDVRAHVHLLHEMINAKQKEEAKRSAQWEGEIIALQQQISHRNDVNVCQLRDLERMEDDRARRLETVGQESRREVEATNRLRDDMARIVQMQHDQLVKIDELVVTANKGGPTPADATTSIQQMMALQQSQIQILQQQRGAGIPSEVAEGLQQLLKQQEGQMAQMSKLNPELKCSTTELQRIVELLSTAGANTYHLLDALGAPGGSVPHTHTPEDVEAAVKNVRERLEPQVAAAIATSRRLQERTERLITEVSEGNMRTSAAESDAETQRCRVKETQHQLAELSEELGRCRFALDMKEKVIGSLQMQVEDHAQTSTTIRSAHAQVGSEAEILRDRLDACEKELSQVRSTTSYDASVLRTTIDRMGQKVGTLEANAARAVEQTRQEVARHSQTRDRLAVAQSALAAQEKLIVEGEGLRAKLKADVQRSADAVARCSQLEGQLLALHEEAAHQRKEHQQTMAHCQHLMSLLRGDAMPAGTPRRAAHNPSPAVSVHALKERMSAVACDAERMLNQAPAPHTQTLSPEVQDVGSLQECIASGVARRQQRVDAIDQQAAQLVSDLAEVTERERRLDERRTIAVFAIQEQSQSLQRNATTWGIQALADGGRDGRTGGKYDAMAQHARTDLEALRRQEAEIMSKAEAAGALTAANRVRLTHRMEELRVEADGLRGEIGALKSREYVLQTMTKRYASPSANSH